MAYTSEELIDKACADPNISAKVFLNRMKKNQAKGISPFTSLVLGQEHMTLDEIREAVDQLEAIK